MRKISIFFAALLMTTCLLSSVSYASIDNVGTATPVTSQVQNNDSSVDEQLKVTTSGSVLTIEGRTQLPPLECTDSSEEGMYGAYFRKMATETYGEPYIYMFPTEETGANGEPVYVFSGSGDFSAVEDGTYLMYLSRGKKSGGSYSFGPKFGKGLLSYNTIIKVSSGKVAVLQYKNILDENQRVVAQMDAKGTEDFLDPTLEDMGFANRDPRIEDFNHALTDSEASYIKSVTEDITAGISTEYEKVKKIYEYVAENVYYDDERNLHGKPFTNPYENLYNIRNNINNGYNSADEKAATVCTGYSAMVIAMSRSLGIPARLVKGKHPPIGNVDWPNVTDLNVETHHWSECYVDGKWIVVDATMGTQNKYDVNTGTWTKTGVSNYVFFDTTPQQIAVNYLIHGLYEADKPEIGEVKNVLTTQKLNDMTVTWNKMDNAHGLEGYYIQCLNEDGSLRFGTYITGTSYTFKNLTAASKYTIRVRGYGFFNGETVYGPYTTVKVCTPPETITVLTTSKNETSVKALWYKLYGVDGYHIQCLTKSGNVLHSMHTTENAYTVTNLIPGTLYKIRVRGYVTLDGKKVYGPYKTVNTGTKTETVKKITTSKGVTSIKVSWEKLHGANGYYVQCLSSQGKVLKEAYTLGNVCTFNQLTSATIYKIRVKGYIVIDGEKIYAAPVAVDTCTKPEKVKKVSISNGTTYIKASWPKVKGIGRYLIQCINSKGKVIKEAYTTGTSYTFSKLSSGTPYNLKIKGYLYLNGIKNFGDTATIKTATKPGKVSIKKLTSGKSHYVKVSWSKRTCSGYQVMIATNSKFSKNKKSYYVSKQSSSKKINKLKKRKYYYVKVRAYTTANGIKNYGSWSNVKKIKCK